jgi:hypothetical protein
VRQWRLAEGPEKEVFFTQDHKPGEDGRPGVEVIAAMKKKGYHRGVEDLEADPSPQDLTPPRRSAWRTAPRPKPEMKYYTNNDSKRWSPSLESSKVAMGFRQFLR